ncbi:hypothetical protein C2845_PM16G04510 [Panicum miliaceum]|uniref:F-box associated beta-propeller type 3 domain-containing protein n=1 Tax=Panicum miliaceum TaxID=4540 RepID=A0A3L6PX24_PANMI|nr:hypothetical protein C2845_PM16G04510 [Panicum miliaceum]
MAQLAAAHAGRPKGGLLLAAVHDAADISRVDLRLVDVASGALDGQQATGSVMAAGGLICLAPTGRNKAAAPVRVLDPATGAATDIPAATAAGGRERASPSTYVFGHLPTTREYKVLRISAAAGNAEPSTQSCEILTLAGGRSHRWRPAPSPPVLVGSSVSRHKAVTQGFAHFLTTSHVADYDGIASFDLAKEEWRPSLLQGPIPSKDRHCCHSSLSLVELNGCLVFVHHDYRSCCIDMWVLADLEKGRWLRIQSLALGSVLRGWEDDTSQQPAPLIPVPRRREIFAQPLMVLDDGRIAFWVAVPNGVVRVYDPKMRKCKDVVGMGRSCSIVGLYRGSQLGCTCRR